MTRGRFCLDHSRWWETTFWSTLCSPKKSILERGGAWISYGFIYRFDGRFSLWKSGQHVTCSCWRWENTLVLIFSILILCMYKYISIYSHGNHGNHLKYTESTQPFLVVFEDAKMSFHLAARKPVKSTGSTSSAAWNFIKAISPIGLGKGLMIRKGFWKVFEFWCCYIDISNYYQCTVTSPLFEFLFLVLLHWLWYDVIWRYRMNLSWHFPTCWSGESCQVQSSSGVLKFLKVFTLEINFFQFL